MLQATEGLWRYSLDEAFYYKSDELRGIEFANRWVTIIDGEMIVSRGYSWDGCSPTYYVPFFGWVGTPDGQRAADGTPQAYYASLVHDVFCQFRGDIHISKDQTLAIFKAMLIEGGFSERRAATYTRFVRLFGPQKWLGKGQPVLHPVVQ